ncbi:hypothetical protein N7466_005391 [Penicillium verhagenii]|uniref:uncharacterized protein n=1 Tax=Penicillium verhagenii TaxID=1562060 RepID=UPI0025459CD9|nr:uncharacterized protein N7466_005391 [Penicillium verhagenii]KAJ5935844.1 hypothetical protein N7466_005391 [Penicillium verhagenii]
MSVATKPSPPPGPQPGIQHVNSSSPTSDSFKCWVKCLLDFASKPELQIASNFIREFEHQQDQIKKLSDQDKDHTIAMKMMASTIEKDQTKQKEVQAKVESLRQIIADQETTISKYLQSIKTLETDAKNSKSDKIQDAAKLERLSDDITSLQKSLKEKDAIINKMKASESNFNDRLAIEKKKVGKLQEQCTSMTRIMEDSQAKLKTLESFRGSYREVAEDTMIDQFSNLWDFATEEMSKILQKETLKDNSTWEKFRKDSVSIMPHNVPLPASTSIAAKGMRLAVTLGHLSREINKHIFQPNYLDLDDNKLRTALIELAKIDGEKESFCRSMLLSIDETGQEKSRQSRILNVSRNVTHNLFKSLSDDKQEEARQIISKIAERATQVWIPLQHAHLKYEPDFEPLVWDDPEWSSFKFPGGDSAHAEKKTPLTAGNFFTIFPRISQIENEKRHPFTYVTQIRTSHPLWSLAEEEMIRSPSSPTHGRMPSSGARRPSISGTSTMRHNGKNSPNGNHTTSNGRP